MTDRLIFIREYIPSFICFALFIIASRISGFAFDAISPKKYI